MRVLRSAVVAVLAAAHGALALHAEDAGKVDWHKSFIGLPLPGREFTPNFHRVPPFRFKQSWKSVIITATQANVLAGINPADSAIVWRRTYEQDDVIVNIKCNDDVVALYGRGEPTAENSELDPRGPVVVAALSGPGGATLRVFEATTGLLTFEARMHTPGEALLTQPVTLSNDIAFAIEESPDVFVLTNGASVTRVHGFFGTKTWRWNSPDAASSVLYTKLATSTAAVYVIGFVKSIRSYTLQVVALDAKTGVELASINVPSDITDAQDSIVTVSLKAIGIPFVVWTQDGKAMSLALTPELDAKPQVVTDGKFVRVLDVNLELSGLAVGIRPDGSAQLLRVDEAKRTVVTSFEFPMSATNPRQYSESDYAGTMDRQTRPYVARTFWTNAQHVGATHVLSTHDGRISGTGFRFDTLAHGFIARGSIDCASPEPNVVVSRTLVTSSTGALQLWQAEKLVWDRDEGLSAASAVEFVDLPERKAVVARTGAESFDERIARHISGLKDLPTYIVAWSQRFLANTYVLESGELWRDPFGFRKVIVVASRPGKVYALDSTNGNVVWSKLLGTDARGGVLEPVRMFVLKTAAETSSPEIVVFVQHHVPGEPSETVAYHFNALDGEQEGMKGVAALSGMLLFKSPLRDAYLLPGTPRVVVLVDGDLKVHMYPQTEDASIVFAKIGESLRFALPATSSLETAHQQIVGYASPLSQVYPFQAQELWRTAFAPGEEIVSVVKRPHEPIASFGKVVAGKKTLYRYLNPHLLAVVTSTRSGPVASNSSSCAVNIVDGAKGTIVYRAQVAARGAPCDVKLAFAQNWLTYHYYDPANDGQDAAKGYRFVTLELYEGQGPDDKSSSPDVSAYSYDTVRVHVVENSFVSTSRVVALATTTTKYGITTRNLIVANSKNQLVSMPRRLLDPRRHKGKPTSADQEEGLIPYEPLVPEDPRMIISHNYQVHGVRHIVTSPALLESTSLVLAYGLDLFASRVTPSGTFDLLSESFNKPQLALTVCGLLVAIIIVKPIARNKLLRQKWYG